jgi:uncharacterized protein (UPF0179 family)
MNIPKRTAKTLLAVLVAGLGMLCQTNAAFVIDSLDGDITPNEISKFVSTIAGRNPATNNWGNAMATHGTEPEGMWRMYDATKNISVLNNFIRWMDVYLAYRNDMPLGEHRVMWEGTVAPCWPNIAPTDPDSAYSGCENGMVAGYIALCAKAILETPTIWNNTVPDGNPYGFGVTYLDRALKYLNEVDYVCETYLRVWFVNPSNNRIRKPTDPRWASNAGNQSVTAWNRQWLFVMAFLYSARCHDLLGDNPSYLATYKDIVQQFGTWFVAPFPIGGGVYYTTSGHDVVKWYYEVPMDLHIENIGHAQHDVAGLFECYASAYTTLTYAQVQPFADTTQFVINKGATNSWADNVDGTSASTYIKSDFIFLSQWNRALFNMIAQSNIDAAQLNSDGGCKNTGYILFMKHWWYLQDNPPTLPSAPVDLTASPGDAQVILSWNPPGLASSYKVKRAIVDGGPYATIATGLASPAYTDAGVVNGTTYYYVVSAVNSSGESTDSVQLSATPTNLVPGLVARQTFDDGTASDSSGFGNDGTLMNGASIVADTDRGNVLLLDGVNDYVDLGNSASLNLSDNNQGTITAWVKIAVSKVNNSILTKGEWKDAYSLLIKGDSSPADRLWTGNDTGVFSGLSVPVGVWAHVAVTINGDQTTFYINGQVAGTANQDRGNPIDNTATSVSIGREQYSGSLPAGRWFFNGRLDDVRIYEVALDQTGIQKAMSNSSGEVNISPVLAAIGNKSVNEGSQLSFTASATNSDAGQTLTFSLGAEAPAGASINASSGAFTWTPTEAQGPGTYNVTVRVTDNGSPNLSDSETIQVTVNEVNAAPVLAAIGSKAINEGSQLSFIATATDSDAPAQSLTFSLDVGAPAGASINASSGVFTWTPTEAQGPGTYNVTVRATDNGSPTLSDSETVQITVNEVNIAPVLAAIGNKSVNEGSTLSFAANATDSDVPAQALTYSLDTGAPSGATINVTTGAFTWTPTETQGPSTISVTVRVTDSLGGTAAETIQITVAEVNTAPVLAAIGNKTATVGTSLTFTASATDGDMPAQALTYSLDAGAPSGASINASSGVFTWTPASAGTSSVTVRVTDSLGGTASETISIVVSNTDAGSGLIAEYYDNADFTGTRVTRIDTTVNFTWGSSSPDPALGTDTFSARWSGQVKPLFSETYTFYTTTDDGVRLWVNGQLLIDKWVNQVPTEWSGSITLAAGQLYDIRMDYYENGGNASASLSWSSASQAKQVIPQIQLYPSTFLPAPWLTSNIGTVSQTGGAGYSSGAYTVAGAGSDIWSTSDNFRFVYQTLSGDGEIKARVSSATGPHAWSKLGVMIRESLNANSANAMMLITPTTSNGFSFQKRTSTGGTSSQTLSSPLNAAPNNWVRLVRSGNTLTGYKSADGVTWTQVGTSVTITMATNIYVGLGVTAHNSTGIATGIFDNVTVVP